MKQPTYILLLCVAVVCCVSDAVYAQEQPFSFSVGGGWVYMDMDQVDADSESDVDGWRRTGIPIDELGSLKSTLFLNAKASYRFDRDVRFSLLVAHAEREVGASYNSVETTLDLRRSVSFTDVMVGIEFYFPVIPLNAQAYAGGEMGFMYARADAYAFGTETEKVADSTETYVTIDTKGTYLENKLVLNAVAGLDIHVLGPIFTRIEAKYKFGKIGTMEGDVRRLGVTTTEETTIEFDFSGLFLSMGIGIVF